MLFTWSKALISVYDLLELQWPWPHFQGHYWNSKINLYKWQKVQLHYDAPEQKCNYIMMHQNSPNQLHYDAPETQLTRRMLVTLWYNNIYHCQGKTVQFTNRWQNIALYKWHESLIDSSASVVRPFGTTGELGCVCMSMFMNILYKWGLSKGQQSIGAHGPMFMICSLICKYEILNVLCKSYPSLKQRRTASPP